MGLSPCITLSSLGPAFQSGAGKCKLHSILTANESRGLHFEVERVVWLSVFTTHPGPCSLMNASPPYWCRSPDCYRTLTAYLLQLTSQSEKLIKHNYVVDAFYQIMFDMSRVLPRGETFLSACIF